MKLIVKNLKKSFGDKEVLKDIDYTFDKGFIYSVIGRNGTGKTTLFNCISFQEKIDAGEILVDASGDIRPISHDDVYLVSAAPVLPEFLTGYEFIRAFVDFNKVKAFDIDKLFERFNFEEADKHRLIKEYSFGMKNKIQMMCAFIKKPLIILLDEPLSSLDIIVSHDIKEMMIAMKSDHIIIMSTHIVQLATDVSDEVAILKDGLLNKCRNDFNSPIEFEKYLMEVI